jgi:hypothetical protein
VCVVLLLEDDYVFLPSRSTALLVSGRWDGDRGAVDDDAQLGRRLDIGLLVCPAARGLGTSRATAVSSGLLLSACLFVPVSSRFVFVARVRFCFCYRVGWSVGLKGLLERSYLRLVWG